MTGGVSVTWFRPFDIWFHLVLDQPFLLWADRLGYSVFGFAFSVADSPTATAAGAGPGFVFECVGAGQGQGTAGGNTFAGRFRRLESGRTAACEGCLKLKANQTLTAHDWRSAL